MSKSVTKKPKNIHSPYLVSRLTSASPNLFDDVKWNVILRALSSIKKSSLNILDLGCGRRKGIGQVNGHRKKYSYLGVDREEIFNPDIVGDVRCLKDICDQLPWKPDVIMMLDILEHLEGRELEIQQVLKDLTNNFQAGTKVFIAVPNLYRLDCLKLDHLYYPEHKVRFTRQEWKEIFLKHLAVESTSPIGFISVIPYLIMFYRGYKENGFSGKFFHLCRNKLLPKIPGIHFMELKLTKTMERFTVFENFANGILFRCVVP